MLLFCVKTTGEIINICCLLRQGKAISRLTAKSINDIHEKSCYTEPMEKPVNINGGFYQEKAGGAIMKTVFEQIRAGELAVPETPCIVVDAGIAGKNIRRVQQVADEWGCKLRPHIKTHKMPYFAMEQIRAGAGGITCAKVSEAEVMAQGGVDDIFIAYPMVGSFRTERAIALQKKLKRLILAVDSIEGATQLNKAAGDAGALLEVRLEVDTGARRTGVIRERCLELAKQISGMKNLKLTGIYTFKSLILQGKPTEDNEAAAMEEAQLMQDMAVRLREEGIPIEDISAGSTPTGLQVAKTGMVTEVRPGTYIFGDWMLTREKCACMEDIAVRLYATVVSAPAGDYAIIDGGTKTFPMDVPLDTAPFHYPGYAIAVGEDGEPDENLQLRRMNEEHGIITGKNGATGLKVGQLLELIPIHVCTAVNMQNSVFVYEGGKLNRLPVAARGMLV